MDPRENEDSRQEIPDSVTEKRPPLFFYGWVIVAVLFVFEFFSYAISGSTVSFFFFPMADTLGWSMTQLAGAITASGISAMIAGPILGLLLDRYGARPILLAGASSAGIALLLLMRVQEVWQYWLLFAVVGALGMGELGGLSTAVVVSKWFIRRRGRAMALATSGTMLGGMVMAPVIGQLITALGWRNAWGLLGAAVLMLNLPIVFLFMRRQPEDIGLMPDGDQSGAAVSPSQVRRGTQSSDLEFSWTLREAVQTRTLWLLVVSSNMVGFAAASVSYHQVPFWLVQGMTIQGASYVLTLSLLLSTLARFLWGFLVERYSVHSCLVAMAAFRALGTLALVAVPYPFNIIPFLLFWSLLGGAFGLLQPMAWANYYGRTFQGSIQGTIRPFLTISRVVGPLSTAVLFDATGSYNIAFLVAFGLAASSVPLFLSSVPPAHQSISR